VSSAKRNDLANSNAFGRSFIYKIKSSGPSIDPWGTPHFILLKDEQVYLNNPCHRPQVTALVIFFH
jgi:hypothetical protein